MQQAISEVTGVINAIKLSFESRCRNNKTYQLLYKTLSKDCLAVANAAFDEMHAVKPGVYDFWWAKEHMRFVDHVKQRELLLLHEIMYHFLTAFSRGELSDGITTRKGKTKTRS